jgi:hypothetical protein
MTRLASDIREAEKPIYCSSCFNQQAIRHVDFDAACDRGYGKEEAVEVAMDDLILCENCVREGAELLGMSPEGTKDDRIADLTAKLAFEQRERGKAERYAGTLEDALNQKGVQLDHRKRPRQLREEVPA